MVPRAILVRFEMYSSSLYGGGAVRNQEASHTGIIFSLSWIASLLLSGTTVNSFLNPCNTDDLTGLFLIFGRTNQSTRRLKRGVVSWAEHRVFLVAVVCFADPPRRGAASTCTVVVQCVALEALVED